MSLRELVVNAIEHIAAARSTAAREHPSVLAPARRDVARIKGVSRAEIDAPWMVRTVTSLLSRVGALEERSKLALEVIDVIQRQADVHWGRDWREPVV